MYINNKECNDNFYIAACKTFDELLHFTVFVLRIGLILTNKCCLNRDIYQRLNIVCQTAHFLIHNNIKFVQSCITAIVNVQLLAS